MKKVLILLVCCVLGARATSQKNFESKLFLYKGDTLPYRMLLPDNYNPKIKYPIIYFLHGSGERGNDNEAQLVHGSKFFLDEQNRKRYPAIVIFPQCPANDSWTTMLRGNGINRSFDNQR